MMSREWSTSVCRLFLLLGALTLPLRGAAPATPPCSGTCFGSPESLLLESAAPASAAIAGDLDGDGDADLVIAVLDEIRWYENVGSGAFGSSVLLWQGASASGVVARDLAAGDVDGDGDLDFAAAITDRVAWFENVPGPAGPTFTQRIVEASPSAGQPNVVSLTDADGDGDLDMQVGLASIFNPGSIVEYTNTAGAFATPPVFVDPSNRPSHLIPTDIDGDGDIDLVSHAANSGRIAWHERDPSGAFVAKHVVHQVPGEAYAVRVADLDGDSYPDIVFSHRKSARISWIKNIDGTGGFGPSQVVSDQGPGQATGIATADFDRDGDIDVASEFYWQGKISWFPNLGDGAFAEECAIGYSTAGPRGDLIASDLDGDGDHDLFAAAFTSSDPAVMENAGLTKDHHYGSGCPGTGGFVPQLDVIGCPLPNKQLFVTLSNTLGGANALVISGASAIDLPTPGGCSLLVSPFQALFAPLPGDGPGSGSGTYGVHLSSNVGGVIVYVQALVIDAGAKGGYAATAGYRLEIGH